MSKFQVGDEVVVKQLTTPGGVEFQDWAKGLIKSQTPIIVESINGTILFKGVSWCLFPRDVEKYQPIMENE